MEVTIKMSENEFTDFLSYKQLEEDVLTKEQYLYYKFQEYINKYKPKNEYVASYIREMLAEIFNDR